MRKILKNSSGITMLFVLGAMLFLLVIGVSVFTASGLSLGAVEAQRARNQLDMYVSSMERVIFESLNRVVASGASISAPVDDNNNDVLGGWVLREAFAVGLGGCLLCSTPSSTPGFGFYLGDQLLSIDPLSSTVIPQGALIHLPLPTPPRIPEQWGIEVSFGFESHIAPGVSYYFDVSGIMFVRTLVDYVIGGSSSYPMRLGIYGELAFEQLTEMGDRSAVSRMTFGFDNIELAAVSAVYGPCVCGMIMVNTGNWDWMLRRHETVN